MRLSQDKWGSRGFLERGRFGRWAEGWVILIRLFHRDTHGYIPCQKYIIVNVEGNHRLSSECLPETQQPAGSQWLWSPETLKRKWPASTQLSETGSYDSIISTASVSARLVRTALSERHWPSPREGEITPGFGSLALPHLPLKTELTLHLACVPL